MTTPPKNPPCDDASDGAAREALSEQRECDASERQGWWSRPCGARDVLKISAPLVISTASWSIMHFCDRMFLFWHSTEATAAAMPAGMLHFAAVCLPLNIATYVNTFVAQYEGAGRRHRVGQVVWQGFRIGLYAVPLYLAANPLAPLMFRLAGHEGEIAALETLYFQVLNFGAGAGIMAGALSGFFTGRGSTRVVMAVDTLASAINVVLDYVWIFGHAGFPALGIEGAGWATVAAQWFRLAAYLLLMMNRRWRKPYGLLAGRRLDAPLMRRLLRYGGPNGLQVFVEVVAFAIFLMVVGRLGPEAMAATTVAFNVNALAWVPLLGLGIGLSALVGQQLGRDRPDLAARATWTAFAIAQGYLCTAAVLYVAWPDVFLIGHAAGTEPERFTALRELTVVLLRFVAAYSLLDAMNVIFAAALKGAGDTRFILITNLVLSPLPVVASWAGVAVWGLGLAWCWWIVTAWVCLLALAFFGRFLQGRWRALRVIEPHLDDEAA